MDKIGIPCPSCHNEHMAPIIYGYPTAEMIEYARQEIIALGGKNEKEYTHYCYQCNEVCVNDSQI